MRFNSDVVLVMYSTEIAAPMVKKMKRASSDKMIFFFIVNSTIS
jgi:hypothetical protein